MTRSVTGNGQNDVTDEYRCQNSRPGTHRRSRSVTTGWIRHGILAVLAALALAVAADAATLFLIAWLSR